MNQYEVTLTGNYEKTISVRAKSPVHAREKIETILFDTNLINFTDDDFVCGEASIANPNEDECEENGESLKDGCCSECAYCCPVCGNCMCEDEM